MLLSVDINKTERSTVRSYFWCMQANTGLTDTPTQALPRVWGLSCVCDVVPTKKVFLPLRGRDPSGFSSPQQLTSFPSVLACHPVSPSVMKTPEVTLWNRAWAGESYLSLHQQSGSTGCSLCVRWPHLFTGSQEDSLFLVPTRTHAGFCVSVFILCVCLGG